MVILSLITFVSIAIGASIWICNKFECNEATETTRESTGNEGGRNTEHLIHWILGRGNKIKNTTSLNMNFENSNLTDAWELLHTNGCKLNITDKQTAHAHHDHIQNFISGQKNITILKILEKINCLNNKKNENINNGNKISNIYTHKKKSSSSNDISSSQ